MADGSPVRASPPAGNTRLMLEEAIARLEAGTGAGILVDLGGGRTARADGHRGAEGLLQRLRGHRMLLALASGAADLTRFEASPGELRVDPDVQEILDAATRRA